MEFEMIKCGCLKCLHIGFTILNLFDRVIRKIPRKE